MATPYWALRDTGVRVGFASIAGGAPTADPGSLGEEGSRKPAVQRFLDCQHAMQALRASRSISDIEADQYDLVFLPGGHGTMWDFRQSDDLSHVIGRAFDRGAVVGAVCHGPAGLVDAQSANGAPIVKGRRINAFTNAEERAVELADTVPYLLESELRNKGALFEGTENFGAYAIRDGNLVTGQNPASVGAVTDLLIEAFRDSGLTAA